MRLIKNNDNPINEEKIINQIKTKHFFIPLTQKFLKGNNRQSFEILRA